ncbi:antitoxin [Streptomyces sp. NPDC001389]|uniref:antitoxin n=1 Tax=Streptomyces sp. NPDC001389 TaxID=3364569 RepID=UPI0036A1F592
MSIVDKLKGLLGQHPDKAKEAVDRGGDVIDERTGSKYSDKVDMGQEKANEYIDRNRPQQP